KVNRSVFNLYEYIIPEFSVKWYKFIVSLLCPVVRSLFTVNKGTPHHDPPMICQGISQHICTFCMCVILIMRPGLPLRISLYQETSKIGDMAIYFIGFFFPPLIYFRV